MRNLPRALVPIRASIFPNTMKKHPLATSLCLLTLTLHSSADTFLMKDGTKYQGKIVREDATSYLLEVQTKSKGIKDERKVAKADVVKIEREKTVQNDFAAISGLVPVPDRQPAADYAQRIRIVEKYLADHRMTAKSKDAEAILATLKAEAGEIGAGAIKLDGKIISSDDYRANQYDIDSHLQDAKIRKLVKEATFLPALRAFTEFSYDFRNTTAYNDLFPLMNQVISSHLAEAASYLASFDARVRKRQAGLERQSAEDRRNTDLAIKAETIELERTFKAEKEAKQVWVTAHPFSREALEDTVNSGKLEQARLATKIQLTADGGKAYRDAMTLIKAKGDSADAKPAIIDAIAAAKTALVPQRYLTILEKAVPGGVAPPPTE